MEYEALRLMLAFLSGLGMGLVFAVLGAGGGILAVPVLLVLFDLPMGSATAGGLAVVFAAASTSALGHARAGKVDWRTAVLFGPASIVGAVLGARLNAWVPERVTAGLFAGVLLLATASLFRAKSDQPKPAPSRVLLAVAGLALGVMTGFLGVGGGFLMVPALIGLAGLPIHRAVGTSAVLITASSLAGSVAVLATRPALLALIAPIAGGAAVGALLGVPLSSKLPPRPLRLAFAALSIVVAAGMAWRAAVPRAGPPPGAARSAPSAHEAVSGHSSRGYLLAVASP